MQFKRKDTYVSCMWDVHTYLSSKMHDCIDLLGFHDISQQVATLNVALDELCPRNLREIHYIFEMRQSGRQKEREGLPGSIAASKTLGGVHTLKFGWSSTSLMLFLEAT